MKKGGWDCDTWGKPALRQAFRYKTRFFPPSMFASAAEHTAVDYIAYDQLDPTYLTYPYV